MVGAATVCSETNLLTGEANSNPQRFERLISFDNFGAASLTIFQVRDFTAECRVPCRARAVRAPCSHSAPCCAMQSLAVRAALEPQWVVPHGYMDHSGVEPQLYMDHNRVEPQWFGGNFHHCAPSICACPPGPYARRALCVRPAARMRSIHVHPVGHMCVGCTHVHPTHMCPTHCALLTVPYPYACTTSIPKLRCVEGFSRRMPQKMVQILRRCVHCA